MTKVKVLSSAEHPRATVEGPFATFPCECDTVNLIVHITNGESLGDDLAECPECHTVISLGDLYAHIAMPGLK